MDQSVYEVQQHLGGSFGVIQTRDGKGICYNQVLPSTKYEDFARDLAHALNAAAQQRRLQTLAEGMGS